MGKQHKELDLSAFDEAVGTTEKDIDLSAFDNEVKKKPSPEQSPIIGERSVIGSGNPLQQSIQQESFSIQPKELREKATKTPTVKLDFSKIDNSDNPYARMTPEQIYRMNPKQFTDIERNKAKKITDFNEAIIKKQEDEWKAEHGDGYLSGIGLGIKFATSKLLKGASNIVPAVAYMGDRINKALTGRPLLEDSEKEDLITATDEGARLGLNKEYQGSGSTMQAVGGLLEFIPAALTAESTGGASFYLNGVGNAYKEVTEMKKNGVKLENGAEDLYVQGRGIVDYFLMTKLNSHSLFPTLPSTLRNVASREASINAIKDLVSSGKPLTAEGVTQAFKASALKLSDQIKSKGVPFLKELAKGYGKTTADLTALSAADLGLKKLSNVVSGEADFKMQNGELGDAIGHILTSDAPVFAAIGARNNLGLLFDKSPVKNEVVEALKKDSSPEGIQNIKENIQQEAQVREWTPDDLEGTLSHVDKLATAVKRIPKTLSDNKYNEAVNIIIGKQNLEEQLSKIKEDNKDILPAFIGKGTPEEITLEAKLEQSDDKLRELATGKKTKYFEEQEEGKEPVYYKQLGGDGKPEKITKERYELEQIEKEAKDTPELVTPKEENPIVDENEAPQDLKSVEVTQGPVEVKEVVTEPEINPETKTPEDEVIPETTPEVVTEDIPQKRNEEVLAKAEEDLLALKKVDNKHLKHEKSLARLVEAKNKGEITADEFNDFKKRFDDVLSESAPRPKVENLTPNETKEFEQEFKEDNLTHHDFIEYENREQQAEPAAEIVQPTGNDTRGSGQENRTGKTEQGSEEINSPQGISKEETRKQREYRGEEDVEPKAKQTLQGMFDEGKKNVDEGTIDPRELAKSVSEKPRNISPSEVNALLYDRQRIKNEIENIYTLIDKAEKESNTEALDQLMKRQLYLEHQRNLNELAVRAGANQNALAQVSMRSMINADYSRSEQEARMRAKNGGELTDEMRAEIKKYADQLEEANRKLKEYEDGAADKAAKKQVLEEQKKQRAAAKASDKEVLKKERVDIINDYLAELKKIRSTTSSVVVPYARELVASAPFMRKLLTNLTKEGVVEFKDVISRIHDEFKEHIEGLTERDVMDVLAGKYNEVKKSKNQLLAQKNAIITLARLTAKMEDMIAGLEREKNPSKLKAKRKDIEELEKKIKELEVIAGEEAKNERARANYVKLVKKNISELDEQIAKGERNKKDNTDKYEGDSEIERLRKEREDKHKELDELTKEDLSPEDRLKKSLKSQIERINEKIKNGDFDKESRPKVELDEEAITLKAKVKKAQNNFDAMAERLDKKKESRINKVLDKYSDINRMFLLSGVKTLGKLYSFAAQRAISTPIEELFNTMNSKVPMLRKIAQRSPRYSGGLNVKAEAKAIAQKASKASWKDTWNVLKTGASELDVLYGKSGVDRDFQLNPSAVEFFGRLHGAFKNSTKRAEFYRSYEKRLEDAGNKGKDINDPNVQFATALEAYADGKRAILMHDNMLTDGYKSFLRAIEGREGRWEGKSVATFFRTLLPIIKIPTNYALEAFDTATLGVRALPYVLRAAIKGAESLTPAQANMVMRTLAKGQFGLAMMTVAYFSPQVFGGYYSGKRDDKDLKAGDVIINGMHIPHWMTHHPILEAMQIAATMRRAIDASNGSSDKGIMEELTSKNRDAIVELAKPKVDPKNPTVQSATVNYNGINYDVYLKDGKATRIVKDNGFREGLKTSISGLSGQVPFFETPGQISAGLKSDNKLNKFEGDFLRNRLEPRLLQETADWSDKKTDVKFKEHPLDYMFSDVTKRDPKTILEHLKVGVPFLRQQVSEKVGGNIRLQQIRVDTDVYELNSEQVKEREKYVTEFVDKYGEKIAYYLKKAGKTDKDIEKAINEESLEYSKEKMLNTHENEEQRGKFDFKLKNQ